MGSVHRTRGWDTLRTFDVPVERILPMHVGLPARSLVPTLDAPVLVALARTTRPLSGRRLAALAGGSHSAVISILDRLGESGLVHAERHGTVTLYVGNRDHVAWPVVEALAGLRLAVLSWLRRELSNWSIPPLCALAYGSFARGDGDQSSDIDVLVIRPGDIGEDDDRWMTQTSAFREALLCLTGNDCHLLDVDLARLARHAAADDPLLLEWRDGIALSGACFDDVLADAGHLSVVSR